MAPRHLLWSCARWASSRCSPIFGQLRFEAEKTYKAQFANVSGLENGNFVRIAGVEVGKVKSIAIQDDSTLLVEFTADDSVVLTEGTRAVSATTT